ncbi:hypothetical protein AVEN_91683-1, partial [Araneus ventricosus]
KGGNSGKEVAEIGFMTEAKDWAGELISGQSTTGRILLLVSFATIVCRRFWIVKFYFTLTLNPPHKTCANEGRIGSIPRGMILRVLWPKAACVVGNN